MISTPYAFSHSGLSKQMTLEVKTPSTGSRLEAAEEKRMLAQYRIQYVTHRYKYAIYINKYIKAIILSMFDRNQIFTLNIVSFTWYCNVEGLKNIEQVYLMYSFSFSVN